MERGWRVKVISNGDPITIPPESLIVGRPTALYTIVIAPLMMGPGHREDLKPLVYQHREHAGGRRTALQFGWSPDR